MENFIDRIIETDKKARELIEQAQTEKRKMMEDAKERAQVYLQKQEQKVREGKKAVDAEIEKRIQTECKKADAEYLEKKHLLDDAFEQNRAQWLKEIHTNILGAQ